MSKSKVCSVELAGGLDNKFRRFLQNPQKILKPYLKEGMTVLDLGCGPGFFTIEIAKMIGSFRKSDCCRFAGRNASESQR